MRIVLATTDPQLTSKSDNEVQFYDYTYVGGGWGLDVGDQIQFSRGRYEITNVQPANEPNYSPELCLLTAKRCGA